MKGLNVAVFLLKFSDTKQVLELSSTVNYVWHTGLILIELSVS